MIVSKKRFIIKLILVILWLGVIFFLSGSNSEETTKHSLGITRTVVTYSIKITNSIHITNIELNDNNINSIIDDIHPYIRKIAHFSEYLILSLLVLLMLKETKLNYNYIFTILFCLLIAIIDETNQLFVDGRVGSFVDVLIDTSGCLLYLFLNKCYYMLKKK